MKYLVIWTVCIYSIIGCRPRYINAVDNTTINPKTSLKLTCLNLSESVTKNDEILLLFGYCDSANRLWYLDSIRYTFTDINETVEYNIEPHWYLNINPNDKMFFILIELDEDHLDVFNLSLGLSDTLKNRNYLQSKMKDNDLLGYQIIDAGQVKNKRKHIEFLGRKIFDKYHYVLETKSMITF